MCTTAGRRKVRCRLAAEIASEFRKQATSMLEQGDRWNIETAAVSRTLIIAAKIIDDNNKVPDESL